MRLLLEKGSPGRKAYSLPSWDGPAADEEAIPARAQRRRPPALPEVSEVDLVRHYTELSQRNWGVDSGFYPLGSCTMKYNPLFVEDIAELRGFTGLHPYQPEEQVQGALELMYRLGRWLADLGGVDEVSLQPAAGAQGELTGLMMIRAYHLSRDERRKVVLIPDSAHGTNPASVTLCGFEARHIPSNDQGGVDLAALEEMLSHEVAALMITNPNTLGLFDPGIAEVARLVHEAGAQLYYDGANMNAVLGRFRPGDAGFDVVHFNLHKTFATPHGGGGPGAGPIGVKAHLAPFLPLPLVQRRGERFGLHYDRPQSIGRVRAFCGNFGVLVRAFGYIVALGEPGLRKVSDDAVLAANYLLSLLPEEAYPAPYGRRCMHEFVVSSSLLKRDYGVSAMDVAKRMLDFGHHPSSVYFPLIVKEAMLVEPTETESRQTLEAFAGALTEIAGEAARDPEVVRQAPHHMPVTRLDEARAGRQPDLRWSGP